LLLSFLLHADKSSTQFNPISLSRNFDRYFIMPGGASFSGFLKTVYLPGHGSDNHGEENIKKVDELFPDDKGDKDKKKAEKDKTKGAASKGNGSS
jgi:hypothetical protein